MSGRRTRPTYTGYNAERDKGMTMVLEADNGTKIEPSFYLVWDIEGGNTGASDVPLEHRQLQARHR